MKTSRCAVAHKPHYTMQQFWPTYKWKTTYCTKSCRYHKPEVLLFLHAIQIVARLRCEHVSLHVKSLHFSFV